MQIEYEQPVPGPSLTLPPRVDDTSEPDVEEEEDETEVEPEGVEEQETVETVEDAGPKQKQKRIIKQRQSLAEKQPGTTIFPISRIKKIIKADKELDMMSSEASFMIAVATEYFIKHFMEEGYTRARLERRKIVNYKDMAAVVARSLEFDFLRDVIPSPMPLSEALLLRKQKLATEDNPTLHESDTPSEPRDITSDLPPLQPSTNPLFPNAIVKKPPNTHAKGSGKPKEPPKPVVVKPVTGKNAPSTPHSLSTRHSARRSLVPTDLEGDVEMSDGIQLGVQMGSSEVAEDERMDED